MSNTQDLNLPEQPSWGAGLYRNLESFPGQLFRTPPIMSMQDEVEYSRHQVVRAARHAERFSEHLRGAIDKKADMVVGPRLMVRATPDWERLGIEDKQLQKEIVRSFEREFEDWAYDSRMLQDGEGHYDFGGMTWMGFRNVTGPDGECAGVIHYDERRARRYNHRWATYVTFIDPDRIETPPSAAANPNWRNGRLHDKDGRMIAMSVRKKHPSEQIGSFTDIEYETVRREQRTGRPVGFHWFVKTRAGQLRGVSNLVTILKQTGMLDKFDDSYLASATINQVLATYIESEGSTRTVGEALAPSGNNSGFANDPWSLFASKLDYYDKTKMQVGGSRIPILPPGDKINMTGVNRAINDPTAFRNGWLRQFASSVGVSFEQLSKNMSDANFSAARMAILDIWSGVMKMRYWYGQSVCNLMYIAVLEEAVKKGRTKLPAQYANRFDEIRSALAKCNWIGPAMPQVDPEKDAKADKVLVENKLESRTHIIATRGRDIETVFDEIQMERGMAEERDFDLNPEETALEAAQEEGSSEPDDGSSGEPKPKQKQRNMRDGDGDGVVNEEESE